MKKDREGKKQDGKFYLRVGKTWVEVSKEVYYGYMDLVWQEEKNEDRRSRCMIGGKRCEGNCEECKHDRTGSPLSLDQMYEEDDYEAPDRQPSVEDQVLSRFLHEALHRELDALPLEDQVLLHDIYFEDIPYTQRPRHDVWICDERDPGTAPDPLCGSDPFPSDPEKSSEQDVPGRCKSPGKFRL